MASSVALSVLVSKDIFSRIAAYQHGMFFDVRPLETLEHVSSYNVQNSTSMTRGFRAGLARADTLLAPWYAVRGTSRIPCLFQWVKHTYDVVATHAAYFGKLAILEYLHEVYTIRFFRGLPLWDVAAANGHLHILAFLRGHEYSFPQYTLVDYEGLSRAMTWAAADGHAATVEYLHSHNIPCDGSDAQSAAAEFGQLAILQWLHARGIGQLTTWAMDKAAKNGHLDVLKWLHDHTNASCTTDAMDEAARHGHLDILQWLQNNRFEGATDASIRYAAEGGHVDVLRWLFVHQPPTSTSSRMPMEGAAQCGSLEAIQLLHDRGWPASKWVMGKAAGGGHLEVVQWLHGHRTEGCTTSAMDDAAGEGHLEVVQWLHHNRTEGCTRRAMDRALEYGHVEVVRWLIDNRQEGCSELGIKYAVQTGRLDFVQWIRRHRGCQMCQLHHAIADARRFRHDDIALYLETGQPDACPCYACAGVAKSKQALCVVQ
ncbi:Aste57867_14580 [Aphanomyces stellatus]|uniref:Aste57867_14580 protein n=1 Tax=Aphanomyces stellatus TaxID=120398 RepID=A0A485L1K5_9STRA|nr:hypothetical protein As57867_014526 [Aphanomyces stellatus]VFT91399.1 Aste57867_14580 [Aphanomyces stellatus]